MSFLYYLCPTFLYGICAGDITSISSLSVYTGQYHLDILLHERLRKVKYFLQGMNQWILWVMVKESGKNRGEKIVTNGIQFWKATLNDWRQILSFKRKSLSINDW